jgi:catalase
MPLSTRMQCSAGHPYRELSFARSLSLTPPPASFATLAYYGVNSFEFTNEKAEVHFGRYQIVPAADVHLLPGSEVSAANPDYLKAEIRKRLQTRPASNSELKETVR